MASEWTLQNALRKFDMIFQTATEWAVYRRTNGHAFETFGSGVGRLTMN